MSSRYLSSSTNLLKVRQDISYSWIHEISRLALLMIPGSQNMSLEELVDIPAQKTQRYTQLLVFKDFGNEYKECKEAIQHILAEIDLRKETTTGHNQKTSM